MEMCWPLLPYGRGVPEQLKDFLARGHLFEVSL